MGSLASTDVDCINIVQVDSGQEETIDGENVHSIGAPDGSPRFSGVQLRSVRGVRMLDGTVGDLHVVDGRISSNPAPGGEPGVDVDATGWRVLPSAVEPHAHLDKALTAPRIDPSAGNDLPAAIAQWKALVAGIDAADIAERALAAVRRYVANGITAIRSHVDVPDTGDPMRGIDALVAVREQLRGRVTLQVCMLAGHGTPDAVLAEAASRGVDVIGGCPHIAPDPHRETARMLDLAERLDLPVDLHADEQTGLPPSDAGLDVVDLAEQVLARGLQQRVTACAAACCRRSGWRGCWMRPHAPGSASSRCRSRTCTCRAATPRTPRRAGSPRSGRSSTPPSRSPQAGTTCATRSTRPGGPTRSRRPPC